MASAIDELARKLVVDLPICGSRTTFATGMAVIQACERPIPSLLAQPIRLPSLPLRSPAPRRGY